MTPNLCYVVSNPPCLRFVKDGVIYEKRLTEKLILTYQKRLLKKHKELLNGHRRFIAHGRCRYELDPYNCQRLLADLASAWRYVNGS